MTHTLFGAIIGFLSATSLRLFEYWRDQREHKQECEMLELQARLAHEYKDTRIEEAFGYGDADNMAAAVERGVTQALGDQRRLVSQSAPWVRNMAALVRPGSTLAFFLLYGELVVAMQFGWIDVTVFDAVWHEPMEALFSTVIAFWFGTRRVKR